ncbi:2-polyprenyl-6-methoxyphenol hydroxylase-like FAD-dependent oxidoreductase [Leucobacter luti]|uniref:FAD-dependent monooxygenase n=1 Tax=Leucobacter luti TaxID=340320 RepID=UPI001044FFD9|nr:FAD-dependent monooxygenase [Leucobacter luti]MCW2289189.1 2-polyprenyl-6-methoxyphenol hydroxylase-like FAD-dependent oxidoreductase [Leucobacter luti]TCK39754.1 2-polyprenyl-6-methoxyphenol hydroxylase-like FAD-dependent oxidoreductase [Leucobacter luti]
MNIAIIGAGPGGLITALRLQQQGFAPTIYETVPELKPLGVGVDIKVYGLKEIEEIGLLEEFRMMSVDAVDSVFYNHFGQEIYAEKCGVHMGYEHEQRFVHRGELQMLFYRTVQQRLGKDAIVLGARVGSYEQDNAGVTLHLEHRDGRSESVRHDAVIAADGINSVVRKQMHPELSEPHYSGITMYRGTTLREPYRDGHTILHIGDPRISSMIVYPIADNFEGSGKTLVNWVVEAERDESVEDWNQLGSVDEILPFYESVDIDFLDVQQLIADAREVYLFPLIRHEPLETWVDGRVVLLGDAAHAMYPRGGNGVCQAFLDARVVAEQLAAHSDPHTAFLAYDEARRVPVNRIVMNMRGEGYEVIRRMVAERTEGRPLADRADIEGVLPLAEADELFSNYHRLVGQPLRAGHDTYSSGFRTWEAEAVPGSAISEAAVLAPAPAEAPRGESAL